MSKAIQDLLALVKLLREEVAHQTSEINHLRRLIENCAGCRDIPQLVTKENCDNSNPCFEGVQCYDASNGVRCGRCPSGIRKFLLKNQSKPHSNTTYLTNLLIKTFFELFKVTLATESHVSLELPVMIVLASRESLQDYIYVYLILCTMCFSFLFIIVMSTALTQ